MRRSIGAAAMGVAHTLAGRVLASPPYLSLRDIPSPSPMRRGGEAGLGYAAPKAA